MKEQGVQALNYIFIIANNERRMLYRMPKFWILAGLGVLFVLFFLVGSTLATIFGNNFPAIFLLEGADAFLAIFFFSFGQAVLINLVAADFRNAEDKARLDQVMLSRPMTTASWVIGKYFGYVSALLLLNLGLILLAATGRLVKMIFTDIGFNIIPFFEYWLIATVPAILFATAFVFFLVSLFRSPALAIILSFGYVGSVFFYFQSDFLYLFDYGCFFMPLFPSDIIGFGNLVPVLMQRAFFIALAGCLLSASILLYPRLPQSTLSRGITQFAAIIFLFAATALGYEIINSDQMRTQARELAISAQSRWHTTPRVHVTHYDFEIEWGNAPLEVNLKMAIENRNDNPLDTLVFALNGGLRLKKLQAGSGRALSFIQEHQLLLINLKKESLQAGRRDTLFLTYAGEIDADAFVLDIERGQDGIAYRNNGPVIMAHEKNITQKTFAALSSYFGWYPIPGAAGYYPGKSPRPKNFATASFVIKTAPDLTAITQGKQVSETIENGVKHTAYAAEIPVSDFSLNIGEYQKLSREFKQTRVEFYYRKNHLRDIEIFEDVADTCYQVIDRVFELFEEVAGTKYPFPKLAFVETPMQMQIFPSRHGHLPTHQQPEIIMLDELKVAGKHFQKQLERKEKNARRGNRDDSPKRLKREVFIASITDLLAGSRWWRSFDYNMYSPMRNYFHYTIDFSSPFLERAIEMQLFEQADRRVKDAFYPENDNAAQSTLDHIRSGANWWASRRFQNYYDISFDTLFVKLANIPLVDLDPAVDIPLFRSGVDFKGPPILNILRETIGEENYVSGFTYLRKHFANQPVSLTDFMAAMQTTTSIDLTTFAAEWFESATFPGYRITLAEAEKMDTGKMKFEWQIRARVQNGERGEGFVRVICEMKNDKVTKKIRLKSYEEKEIIFSVSARPGKIKVLPYFSRNRGPIVREITIANRVRRGTPVDSIFTVSSSLVDSLVFYTDDQDAGFFTPYPEDAAYFRPPIKGKTWWDRTNERAYGKYHFGWRRKRGGEGEFPARWETSVPKTGSYDLSFNLPVNGWWARNLARTFKLTITDANGLHSVEMKPQETVDGWIYLGRFNFEKGLPAIVELSDEGSGYIIADAIRWEFVQ